MWTSNSGMKRENISAGPGGRPGRKRSSERGLTLVELIVAFTVLLVLTSMAVPLARSKVRAERERDLRAALRDVRAAIDLYHDLAMANKFGPVKIGSDGYPESLEIMVDGVPLNDANGTKMRLLRRVPAPVPRIIL